MRIYVVSSGEYEDKDTFLVTTDLDKALSVIPKCESPTVEVWENDDCKLVYGFQQSDAINNTKDVSQIKEDLLKQLNEEKW